MALENFIQANKIIPDWVQQQIDKRSVAQNVVSVRRNVNARSVDFPVASAGTLYDYTPGQDITLENVSSTKQTITLDTTKAMTRNIDNIEDKKSAQDIAAQVSRDMGNQFATHIDTSVFSSIFTEATITSAALGVTLTPIAVTTPAEAEAYILELRNTLLANDIDLADAYAVVDHTFGGLLMKAQADSNRQNGNSEAYGSGYVTTVFGIPIWETNNLPSGVAGGLAAGETAVIGGHRGAGSLAIDYDVTKTGDSMPVKDGEYIHQVLNHGNGANNPALLIKGVVTH